MAARQRLNIRRIGADLPIFHLAIGIAVLLLIVIRRPREGDALPFFPMAERMAQGLIPYRDFTIEYPPISLVHIYLPRLLGGPGENAYEWAFTFISILVTLATGAAVYWLARRGWSGDDTRDTLLVFTALVLAGLPLVIWRFDILPALFTTLALAAFAVNRDGWTGVALGLGTVTKLYPAFLGPVFFGVRLAERRFRSAAALVLGAGVTVGTVAVGLYLLAGLDAFSYILYQDERGVEIESVGGGLALLADALGLVGARVFFDFGSFQVTSSVFGSIALPLTLFNAALLVALVGSAVVRFRADVRATGSVAPSTTVALLVATLLVVILTNKVLSPQYLVWLLPLAALLPRGHSLLLAAILALTTLIYPLAFGTLVEMFPPTVIALNVRNLLLLVMFVWMIWPPRAPRSESGHVGDATD